MGKNKKRKIKAISKTSAFTAVILGTMNIISALFPVIPARLRLLEEIFPKFIIFKAQSATVILGLLIIVLSYGLYKRRERAFKLVLGILIAETLLNIFKGLDYEESIITLGFAFFIYINRNIFSIKSYKTDLKRVLTSCAIAVFLYYSYIFTGFIILKKNISPHLSFINILVEPFRLVFDTPYFRYLTLHAKWFERSEVIIGTFLLIYSIIQLIKPFIPKVHVDPSDIILINDILKKYGEDSLSYFSLQDNREYYFDSKHKAYISYSIKSGVAIVAADPIGPPGEVKKLINSFLIEMSSRQIKTCFLGISEKYAEYFSLLNKKVIKIGEEAVINLEKFDKKLLTKKVRRAEKHIENLGITYKIVKRSQISDSLLLELEDISNEWFKIKGKDEYGFSMTLGRLPRESDPDCEFIIAFNKDSAIGYLGLVPVYKTKSWSLDAMRRKKDSPNGLTEYLVIKAAIEYKNRGCKKLSLNFATFANSNNEKLPNMNKIFLTVLFNHSATFNLKTLYFFNKKFNPDWESRYIVVENIIDIPEVALAIIRCERLLKVPFLFSH